MKTFFLKSSLNGDNTKKGIISGTAYSGEAIPSFMCFNNFIVDLETLRFSKPKVPLLRDHLSELVAGHATVKLEDDFKLSIDGIISKKTSTGQEIISLSEDDFDWELSIGVYEGFIEESFSGEVNGRDVENAVVLRNGLLREVSIVALGADKNTEATILKQVNKETLKMNEKDFKKLMEKMGLSATAKFSEIIAKLELDEKEKEEAVKEKEEVIESLEETIEQLGETVEKLEEEIADILEDEAVDERAEEIEAEMKEKGLSLAKSEIKKIAMSKESTDLFKSTIKNISVSRGFDKKFSRKIEMSDKEDKTVEAKTLREKASALVKSGEAKNFMEALKMLKGE